MKINSDVISSLFFIVFHLLFFLFFLSILPTFSRLLPPCSPAVFCLTDWIAVSHSLLVSPPLSFNLAHILHYGITRLLGLGPWSAVWVEDSF